MYMCTEISLQVPCLSDCIYYKRQLLKVEMIFFNGFSMFLMLFRSENVCQKQAVV